MNYSDKTIEQLEAMKEQIEDLKNIYHSLVFMNDFNWDKIPQDVHSALLVMQDTLIVKSQTIDVKLKLAQQKEKMK